jgi:2-oxoglutarate dehydrogenase E2 component (dihydrolipoamide succinyltransferase)
MIAIKVPPLGESVLEATVSRWAKNPGDAIAAGETVVELETDKVTVEVPALKPGVLASQSKHEGDVVKVDDLLGEIDDTARVATQATAAVAAPARAAALADAVASSAAAPAPPASTSVGTNAGTGTATKAPAPPVTPQAPVRASPAAQRLAAREGVDLSKVPGTGRGGVVSKPDVIDQAARGSTTSGAGAGPAGPPPVRSDAGTVKPATKPADVTRPNGSRGTAGAAAPAAGTRETREKMSTRRKRIAENLLQAQHATAHLTTFNEIDMSAVSALRDRVRPRIEEEHGLKLSYMPFFVKAACIALEQYPVVNAQIDGDTIIYKHYVNMGIAVASEQGLVVPVIRDAEGKSLLDVAREIGELATRSRAGKLAIEDLTGGTFTITNGGVFGSLLSTPIVNYPQVGILGLHKIQERPVALNGQVVIRPMMYVALSYDHRLVDGEQAVLFLVRIKELMEDPAEMLVA